MPLWSLVIPLAAAALLALSFVLPPGAVVSALSALALVGAVIAAVPHAEVIAHRVGAAPPSTRTAWWSAALLLVALVGVVGVVGLAKVLSPAIEVGLASVGAPAAVLGIAIALLLLLPETVATMRAARANRLQTCFNLAYGSGLASIGLTIPAVAVASVWLGLPLTLGIDAKDLVLLTMTFVVSAITLVSGRSHVMQGAVHLVIFAAFLFLALVP